MAKANKKPKKQKKDESSFVLMAVIYGIFDCDTKELVKVSLDKDEIDMDLSIQYTDNKYSWCEFTIALTP